MQKIFALIIFGFIAGIFIRSFLNWGWALPAFFVFLGLIFTVFHFVKHSVFDISIFVAIFLIAIGLGIVRYEFKDMYGNLAKFENNINQQIFVNGIVIDEPDERENYTRYIVESDKAKILVYTEHYPKFNYGDEIKIMGILKKPKDFSSDFSWQDYLAKDDIFYEMFYPKIDLMATNQGNWIKSQLFKLKKNYLEVLSKVLPEPHTAFMAGLTVGAKQSIPKELQEDFRKTGIIHIVVLSGYNITLVADTIVKVFAFLPRIFSTSLGILGIILFAILTGASATVVRASFMALLVILARAT
ncbi:ComEC family competence protein, partial [Patescibacteria group bacterium]|nr:ComEC family competence protein [Patescibacteria group bacterium]